MNYSLSGLSSVTTTVLLVRGEMALKVTERVCCTTSALAPVPTKTLVRALGLFTKVSKGEVTPALPLTFRVIPIRLLPALL